VPADAAADIGWGMQVTTEAEEPEHVADAFLWFFLRDEDGEIVHGGRFRFYNETPELLSMLPGTGDDGENHYSAIVSSMDEVGLARIRIEEMVTGLTRIIELPVGPNPAAEEQD
ncbi:MAG: hypothetical protein ACOCVR_04775, partial [Myxococcota bacterium]